MKLVELQNKLEELLSLDSNPVVAHIALWPFFRVLDVPQRQLPMQFLQMLQDLVGSNRDLIMPTFTNGYHNGICDLDVEKCYTGVVAEAFRKLPNCERSLSAFFSYAILGPSSEAFGKLQPENAWGDGSTYEWMEKENASFLMLGTHPTHCAFLHRMEWLSRERINYRYVKPFSGEIIRGRKKYNLTEKLYVRSLTPPVVNDFTTIYACLRENGMSVEKFDDVSVAHMTATKMRDAFLPLLWEDPLITVKNRADYEN